MGKVQRPMLGISKHSKNNLIFECVISMTQLADSKTFFINRDVAIFVLQVQILHKPYENIF